ncbi:MAG: RNA methyltransferase [bacterium]
MKNLEPLGATPWFPFPHKIALDGHDWSAEEIVTALTPFLKDERRKRLDAVAAARTFGVATVVDGLYDRGNVSAVMRSAEGLGFAPFHVVETQARFKKANRVTQGSDKWLEITRWKDPALCAKHLKALGYQIVTTHLEAAKPIDAIDFTRPTALVLGNEKNGVSQQMLDHTDHNIIIPMSGFAQSFNISVAAAISLYHIRLNRDRAGMASDLTPEQLVALRAQYYLRSVGNARAILARLADDPNKVDGVA